MYFISCHAKIEWINENLESNIYTLKLGKKNNDKRLQVIISTTDGSFQYNGATHTQYF